MNARAAGVWCRLFRQIRVAGRRTAGRRPRTSIGGPSRCVTIRWFVLSPEVRGRGLGRRLLGEMLARASEVGYTRVWLETFNELEAAAHLYRDHGFDVVSADESPRWGRERSSISATSWSSPPPPPG